MENDIKILDTLDKGSELTTLKALQYKIAATIDESASGRDIAALSRQLREVSARIAELDEIESNGDTVLDQVIRKHAKQRVREIKD